jgi:hypothetical protein
MNKFLQTYWPILAALAIVIFWALDYISMEILITGLGLIGFSGLAELRLAIASSGIKTHIVAAIGGLNLVGYSTGYVTVEKAVIIFAILGIGALSTLRSGVQKANGLK